jgi:hypothetical protein
VKRVAAKILAEDKFVISVVVRALAFQNPRETAIQKERVELLRYFLPQCRTSLPSKRTSTEQFSRLSRV